MDDGLPVSGSEDRESPTSAAAQAVDSVDGAVSAVRLTGRGRGGPRRRQPPDPSTPPMTPAQRIVLLDVWSRSGLGAPEFSTMVGVTAHTLYEWKRRFQRHGPAGLMDRPRGPRGGSRLPEATQRSIILMKEQHQDWGAERIHDMLMRCEGYGASTGAILRVLKEAGYEVEETETAIHEPVVHRFERARANQLWQSDLFTFLIKRENRRVYLVVFLDDYSRFVVGYGAWASAGGALVREVLEAAIANFGAPEEVLTDNGPQYVTWRGKSGFAKLLERRGIRHVIARPRHPQTLGKTERFWGTLWRECLQGASFVSLEDARKRVGHFIDHYNFQRPHQGIEGLVPADRFFAAAPEVLTTLRARVAANALELAQHGVPRKSFYLTGRIGDAGISVHTEGSRVVLTGPDGDREEVDLEAPGRRVDTGEEAAMPEPLAPWAPEHADQDDVEPEGGEE
jgi:transposase InsO family protein